MTKLIKFPLPVRSLIADGERVRERGARSVAPPPDPLPTTMRPSRGEGTVLCKLICLLLFAASLLVPRSSFAENHLKNAKSRYLLQHATNPVDWYAWGPEPFAEAKRLNRPIFLSIGYSTCYWCHRMAEESFSDVEIAKLMNEAFVSIKVDREERPDVDSVYLAVTRTLTGEAGWPNNVILTPDGKPFYAAAYVPKEKFRALVPRLSKMWAEQHDSVVSSADMVVRSLRETPQAGEALTVNDLTNGYRQLAARFDAQHGGFLPPPKFPSAHHLMFLLRYWSRTKDAKALAMVETTLHAMRNSALWDARALGFHRYASDAAWSEPHYEKMLYDQAMLALVYLEAFQATRKNEYAQTARDIFSYALKELRSPDGGFYAAQDSAGIDRKIIADWNGLMIAALAFGANVLDEPSYARAAAKAADAVIAHRRPYLDDYAFLVWGLLNLYEATFDVRQLQRAIDVNAEAVKRFSDDSGRFYITSADSEQLLVRPRETGDGAIPSGNSVELMNLVRLARMTGDEQYEKKAQDLLRSVADDVSLAPSASPHLLSALDFVLGPSLEIVLAGDDPAAMRRAVFTRFVPNKVVMHRPKGNAPPITAIAPFTKDQRPLGGKTTAYVCTNYLCRLPTTDPNMVWK
jgi:uncharacterized protein YyaL (SSP411 family)